MLDSEAIQCSGHLKCILQAYLPPYCVNIFYTLPSTDPIQFRYPIQFVGIKLTFLFYFILFLYFLICLSSLIQQEQ